MKTDCLTSNKFKITMYCESHLTFRKINKFPFEMRNELDKTRMVSRARRKLIFPKR